MSKNGKTILRDLGDGLILRCAHPGDSEALAAFNARVHSHSPEGIPNEEVAVWTRDLMRGDHPAFSPEDCLVVEEKQSGAIVSSVLLIPQTWTYGGIPLGVGRPELVGTLPEYRGRGLVAAQFETIHRWSTERGHLMQAITGIPNFYRQYGYEMGLDLDGWRAGPRGATALPLGVGDPYNLRPAVPTDVPFIAEVYSRAARRHAVSCVRDEALWRYELAGRSVGSLVRHEVRIIESDAGAPVGILMHSPRLGGGSLWVGAYELAPGVSWLAVTPSVLRYLDATGEAYAAREPRAPFTAFQFQLGSAHPVYQVLSSRLPRVQPPYAWYVRVPDLPAFLRHVAPVLERRLAESLAPGHTGELRLSFFRDGLRLGFTDGRLASVSRWKPAVGDRPAAAFPDNTFLQILFGYRSLEELEHAFADCRAHSDDARLLLNALFPKCPSDVWAIE